MHHGQMKTRCPRSQFIRRASLSGYRLIFDGTSRSCGGAVPNIIRSKEGTVWGGIFEIDEGCLLALDDYEVYPSVYQRKKVRVTDDSGQDYRAIVYLRTGRHRSHPSGEFRAMVLEGACHCDLPAAYIREYLR